jgi:hypothetical protein
MEFGKTIWINSDGVKRVPGGWIFMFRDQIKDIITSSVFVPFDNEFLES